MEYNVIEFLGYTNHVYIWLFFGGEIQLLVIPNNDFPCSPDLLLLYVINFYWRS